VTSFSLSFFQERENKVGNQLASHELPVKWTLKCACVCTHAR